ncbi:hypothetical protein AGMMS49579_13080 [Spirochaetia bacterium]|nr:hypothetical protein AGMMS49579_13080 [Spirochaetia bacterium]
MKVWEVQELSLNAAEKYENPYRDIDVWIDLKGPGFEKRVFGFWDGGDSFKIRFTATEKGSWTYTSGASRQDRGLCGKTGSFTALPWTEEEKQENISRRGILRPDKNGHSFVHPDGKSFFMVGDTWWAAPTFRFKWSDDERARPLEAGYFKDLVKFRAAQGYNTIAMLAGHPSWANDALPPEIEIESGVWARSAWKQAGTESAKDMHNEGGRPFLFPGSVKGYEKVVPDFNRINPEYFRQMDKKVDCLHNHGILSFIEVARRDISTVWKKYGGWPETYTRYIQYVFARYQAHFCLFSPIHFDWPACSIPSREFNEPINLWLKQYGPPPFGTLLGTNASPSTLVNFGGSEDAPWLTFHQTGNWREHDHHWYLTDIYRSDPPRPAIAGEPYYPGFPDDNPPLDSHEAELNCRAGLYGSLLSGALGGFIYGAQGLWSADVEKEAVYKITDAIKLKSGAEAPLLKNFIFSEGDRYKELIPDSELVTPNKAGSPMGYRGWAFCMITAKKDYALIYLEKDCPPPTIRGFLPNTRYRYSWFDPEKGQWAGETGILVTDGVGRAVIPLASPGEDVGIKFIQEENQ